jgi:hypothetical protein
MSPRHPWYLHVLLLRPSRIERRLAEIEAAGLVPRAPNLWQLSLGVLRMQHRLIFRSETVGTCVDQPVRPTWRARLLHHRAVRVPFLLKERAIAPLDMSGLLSSEARVRAHLLGAHHDGAQFVYDLQMLAAWPGALARVREAAREVAWGDSARARWLRDLCVFDGYHESLLAAVDRALAGDLAAPGSQEDDPDISFFGYLRWCARQPATPRETLDLARRGLFSLERGRIEASC